MPTNRYPLIAKEGWRLLAVLFVLMLLAYWWFGLVVFMMVAFVFLLCTLLLRDPHRKIPAQPLAVVSPVHGTVTLIEKSAEDVRLAKNALRIQIRMRPFDIYSLRSPIEGKLIEQWCAAPDKNESHRHVDFHIQSDEGDNIVTAIRLRDIIGRLCIYLQSGERIGQGQRCGYVYFGGVVDVFLPRQSAAKVKCGQYVYSGSTVLAELVHATAVSAINNSNS